MRKIAIRIDDVTDDMDWEKFGRFEEILNRYHIKPLIGVIPKNQDETLCRNTKKEDYADWLKDRQKNGWFIAMHGYDHRYVTKKGGMFPLNHFSEFAGLEYEEQLQKLKAGKEALSDLGISTDIFMAPAHSYDYNTLKALGQCGFTHITDGFGSRPYIFRGIVFLPIAKRRSAELKAESGITTFVVHTATMREEDMIGYEQLFQEHKDQFVDYNMLYQMPAVKRSVWGRWMEYWMAVLKHRLLS